MELFFYRAEVKKIIDGDTLDVLIDVGFNIHFHARIRLYGVNTPESRTSNKEEKVMGLAAKDFTKKWVEDNQKIIYIKTVLDKNEKYGRVLAEVYDETKNSCLNKDIINSGFAREYFGEGDKTWTEFKK